MTTINHSAKPANLKQAVRQIRDAVKKVASSKEPAVCFLRTTDITHATVSLSLNPLMVLAEKKHSDL